MPLRIFLAWFLYAAACHGAPPIAGDGSLGTAISRTGNAWSINGGTQMNGNLFQSFSRFNVPTGQSATFYGANDVLNIVGRVTGPDASNIDGLLRSSIPGASLWLMNPKGVVFGPHASLDLGGSFHVTTADYLKLGASGQFNATNPGASSLSSAPPSAFGFLGPAAAPIIASGTTLQVPDGKELSLVGGDITLANATLKAPGGRIELRGGDITATGSMVSVDSDAGLAAGRIVVRGGMLTLNNTWLTSNNLAAGDGGGIDIALDGDFLMKDGVALSWTSGGGAAGDIAIRARNISLLDGATLEVTTFGPGRGGAILLDAAQAVALSGNNGSFQSSLFNSSDGTGDAGRIVISAPRFAMDGALVSLQSHVGGNAGNFEVQAGDIALVNGSRIDSTTFAGGRGGAITLVAGGSISMSGGSSILSGTRGAGSGGTVTVSTPLLAMSDAMIFSQSNGAATVTGNGGNVTVRAGRITMDNGAQINTSTFTAGGGGAIDVGASEAIVITGFNDIGFISGFLSGAMLFGRGGRVSVATPLLRVDGGLIGTAGYLSASAGDIEVRAGRVELANGGRIDASTFGSGSGGAVSVAATDSISILGKRDEAVTDRLLRQFVFLATGVNLPDAVFNQIRPAFGNFSSSGIASRAIFAGDAGPVSVSARDILMGGGGVISSESRGSGNAGGIAINAANSLRLLPGSAITTEATSADGGDITIKAASLVYLSGSQITTSVNTSTGKGGNISIDPAFVVLDNSEIIARAARGQGGNINIVSDFYLNFDSLVDASSQQGGISGSVQIAAPKVDVNSSLTTLNANYLDASSLMRESCAARAGRAAANSFTGTGRGGLAQAPAQSGMVAENAAAERLALAAACGD